MKEEVLYALYLANAQCLAEANFDRELTDTELKRLSAVFYNEDIMSAAIDTATIECIEKVFDEDEEWKKYDEENKDKPLKDFFYWLR